jgi:hypothetical protein
MNSNTSTGKKQQQKRKQTTNSGKDVGEKKPISSVGGHIN